MANAYVQYMIQKSLSDIGLSLDEFPQITSINDKKTQHHHVDINVLENNEFDVMFAQNAINTFTKDHNNCEQTIPSEAIINISRDDSDCIRKSILLNKKEKDLVSFVDYRFIIRGLKRSYKGPVKFINQNERTKPNWLRKIKFCNNDKTNDIADDESVTKTSNGMDIIEINDNKPSIPNDDVMYDYKMMNHFNQSKLCLLNATDNFWENIKNRIHNKPLIDDISTRQKIITDQEYFIPSRPITAKINRKGWQDVNKTIIKHHEKTIKEINTNKKCLWQNLSDLINMLINNGQNNNETLSSALVIVDQLIKEYLVFCGKDKLYVTSAEMSSLFYNKRKSIIINKINQKHYDERQKINKKDCHVCLEFKQNDMMRYVLLYTSFLLTRMNKTK